MPYDLDRFRISWSGLTGLPGMTNMYRDARGSGPAPLVQAKTFFDSQSASLPTGLTISYPSVDDELDSATGKLIGRSPITPPANSAGSASGPAPNVLGVVVEWLTNAFVNGRNVQGRWFIVPVGSNWNTGGQVPDAGKIAALATAATAFVSNMAGTLAIYHRPKYSGTTLISPGQICTVTAARVPAKWAILKSRRDS